MDKQLRITPAQETHLKCLICGFLLSNPYQSQCGCRCCFECWKNYLGEEEEKVCVEGCDDCVTVSLTNSQNLLHPDPGARRDSKKVRIFCINRGEQEGSGCREIIQYRQLEDHLTTECQYNQQQCSKCHQLIPTFHFDKHEESECDMKLLNCKFCELIFTRIELNSSHMNVLSDSCCKLFIGPCPYCNTTDLMNIPQINIHRKTCKLWQYPCKFKSIGCEYVGVKGDIQRHISTHLRQHIKSLGDTVTNNDFIINYSVNNLNNINKTILHLDDKFKTSKVLFAKCEEHIANFINIPTHHSNASNTSSSSSIVHKGGLLIWKITNLNEKMLLAQSGRESYLESESFYTSPFGYKICARIYLNGDGRSKGQHMSFFIAIMKGEYDDILTWPFPNKVTLSLLDQSGRNDDQSQTFRPDPSSPCFRQPVTDINVASGIPNFISLSSLSSKKFSDKNQLFVKVRIHSAIL